ncbi:MAG: hypothetical protein ACP5RD_02455 [bacterium]|jgi:hypothetical protein
MNEIYINGNKNENNLELSENKLKKISKRKLLFSAIIGAVLGVVSYIIYENLDTDTKYSLHKQIKTNLKNLINNIIKED